MTKKNILWISGVGGGIFIFLLLMILNNFCGDYVQECKNIFGILGNFLFSFPVIFLLSLITYKMRDEVFEAWRNFSYWWIPLTMFLTLITPDSNSVIMSWGKEVPAMGMTILYVFISIIIILRTWFKTRKEGAVADKS